VFTVWVFFQAKENRLNDNSNESYDCDSNRDYVCRRDATLVSVARESQGRKTVSGPKSYSGGINTSRCDQGAVRSSGRVLSWRRREEMSEGAVKVWNRWVLRSESELLLQHTQA